jgi:hypothetical protein
MGPRDYPTNGEAQVILLDAMALAAVQGWHAGRAMLGRWYDSPTPATRRPAASMARWLR